MGRHQMSDASRSLDRGQSSDSNKRSENVEPRLALFSAATQHGGGSTDEGGGSTDNVATKGNFVLEWACHSAAPLPDGPPEPVAVDLERNRKADGEREFHSEMS